MKDDVTDGTISVYGNYDGNTDSLVKALNDFCWHFSGESIQFRGFQGKVSLTENKVRHPTAFPLVPQLVFADGDRVSRYCASVEMLALWEEEKRSYLDVSHLPLELKYLSAHVSPSITSGALEVIAVAAGERPGDSYYERLVIRSAGSASRRRTSVTENSDEFYSPAPIFPSLREFL
jgi:hypothetical protein